MQFTVSMIDGDGKAQPLRLPTIDHQPCIPEVMFVDLNQVDDDQEGSFGSDEPSAPKVEPKEYLFQDFYPVAKEAEIWATLAGQRELPAIKDLE